MIIREATVLDIPAMQIVRNAVKENQLPNPLLVSDADYVEFMTERGKGWIAVEDKQIVGFAIADLKENNIWALFLLPESEGQGIGRKLHDTMMNWYFTQTEQTVWLGTAPHTRAAGFYKAAGWQEVGMNGSKELKFEMIFENWKNLTLDML